MAPLEMIIRLVDAGHGSSVNYCESTFCPTPNGSLLGPAPAVCISRRQSSITQEKGSKRSDGKVRLVPPTRIERAARGLGNRCSIQLSYGGVEATILNRA